MENNYKAANGLVRYSFSPKVESDNIPAREEDNKQAARPGVFSTKTQGYGEHAQCCSFDATCW